MDTQIYNKKLLLKYCVSMHMHARTPSTSLARASIFKKDVDLFKKIDVLKNKIVVFSPHPDDETLGCGGTIMKKIAEGYEIYIAILTDGSNAFKSIFNIEFDPTPEELKHIRINEVKDVTYILGVPEENIYFLNFEDGSLEKYENDAINNIIDILDQINPLEVYCSSKKDANLDHKITYRLVKKAIKKLNLNTKLYTYSINQQHSILGPIFDRIINIIKKNMVFIDISDYVEIKRSAIYKYKSITSIISKNQKRQLLNKKRIIKYTQNKEIFYIY